MRWGGRKDRVARQVIRIEEAVIPVLNPKLVMKLAYLIGKLATPLTRHCRG